LRKASYLIKNIIVAIFISLLILPLKVELCKADESVSIKSIMKIHRQGGYVILINYETEERWTDNIIFKVYCKFKKGNFTFTSGSLSNIERGWHKTQVDIPEITKRRHGSLLEYRVDLYKKGILIDSKTKD